MLGDFITGSLRERNYNEPCTPLLHTKLATFVLMFCMDDITSSLDPTLSLLNLAIFELSNSGNHVENL